MLSIIKTEQSCLNCIWDNPDLLYKLDQDYWNTNAARSIKDSIQELYENKVPITINEIVAIGNKKDSTITKENLEKLRNQEYDIASFDFYLKNLRKNWAKEQIEDRLLKNTLLEVSKKGDLNVEVVRELVADIDRKLEVIEGKDSLLRSLNEVAENYRGVLIKRKRGEYKFSTGDSHLDSHLAQGFPPGEITTLFGATGVGKSMFALNLVNKQINKRIPSVYYTLEMSEIASMDRLISIRQKIPASFFRLNEDGELPDEAFKLLEQESRYLKKYEDSFFLVENPSISLSDFEVTIKEAQKRMNTRYLIATVDLFTMLSDVGQKADEIEQAMNKLHSIVKRTGIHALIVVQANRSADGARVATIEQINNLRPSLNHIKNANAMAERSRLVLGAFRPKYYASRLFPESEDLELMEDQLQLQILKQSSGEVGKIIRYVYDAECFRVYPLISEEDDLDEV